MNSSIDPEKSEDWTSSCHRGTIGVDDRTLEEIINRDVVEFVGGL
jgi:hypothetical protein